MYVEGVEDIVVALPRWWAPRARLCRCRRRQVEAVLSWSEARRVETALRPSVSARSLRFFLSISNLARIVADLLDRGDNIFHSQRGRHQEKGREVKEFRAAINNTVLSVPRHERLKEREVGVRRSQDVHLRRPRGRPGNRH